MSTREGAAAENTQETDIAEKCFSVKIIKTHTHQYMIYYYSDVHSTFLFLFLLLCLCLIWFPFSWSWGHFFSLLGTLPQTKKVVLDRKLRTHTHQVSKTDEEEKESEDSEEKRLCVRRKKHNLEEVNDIL